MKDIELWFGDCLELMKNIPENLVDMVLCDLPYGTTACKWDTVIPFEPLWIEYKKVLKQNRSVALFGAEPFSSIARTSNLKWFKYDWIWHKSRPTGFAQAKNQPLRDYENIMLFSEGAAIHASQSKRRMIYNPQGLKGCHKIKRQGRNGRTDTCFSERKSHKPEHIQKQTNYPRQVLESPSLANTIHPTQKPVPLMEYLIRTYTNEGDLVLDNCMGSGSTAIACIKTGRKFVGIDNGHYKSGMSWVEIAEKRIEHFKKTGKDNWKPPNK